MLPQFQPELVMKHLLHQEGIDVNLFMAVPTIYAKLIEHIRGLKPDPDLAQKLKKNVRLMVSGSAALPQVSGLFL
jgi:malonyl-CoA/methylmalonyl-CoA synthetase